MNKRNTFWMLLFLLVTAMLVAACGAGGASPPDAAADAETPAGEAVMEKSNLTGEETMAEMDDQTTMEEEKIAGEAMTEKVEADDDAMMEKDDMAGEEMTAEMEDQAVIEEEEMAGDATMGKDDTADGTMTEKGDIATDDAMMEEEKMAGEAMMDKGEAVGNEAMMGPAWFHAELIDANTGKTFKIADFKGQVVLVETMAAFVFARNRLSLKYAQTDTRSVWIIRSSICNGVG